MAEQLDSLRASAAPSATWRRHRRRQPHDRTELERRGWRTTLEYRENHHRGDDGALAELTTVWRAEGERVNASGEVVVVAAMASNPAAAWRRLRVHAERTMSTKQSESVATR